MKHIEKWTVFGMIWLILLSCSKTSSKNDITVTGQIIDSVSNEPIAHTSFVLYVHDNTVGWNSKPSYEEYSFATDEHGYFRVIFNDKDADQLEIDFPGAGANGNFIWAGGIHGREINTGVIYTSKR